VIGILIKDVVYMDFFHVQVALATIEWMLSNKPISLVQNCEILQKGWFEVTPPLL
jgi:hypothetical protein